MTQRISQSNAPQLIFTADFHQLLRGRLQRGSTCTIRYDPDRIVAPGDNYLFGDPGRAVVAHLQFKPDGPVTDLTLSSAAGLLDYAPTTVTGEGPMLTGAFDVPADAEWVMVWFTFTGADGAARYDSNNGANSLFRFQYEDVELLEAAVTTGAGAPLSYFTCRVEADASVEAITARYRVTNSSTRYHYPDARLQRTSAAPGGRAIWELTGAPVPQGSVVAFDLLYYVGGRRYKDNNQGRYFIAADPERMKLVGLEGNGHST
jgi:hypothetical protein